MLHSDLGVCIYIYRYMHIYILYMVYIMRV